MKRIGWIAIWTSAFAVAGGILGPGCDADAGPSALAGAGIGAFVGATGWRGAGMLLGLLIGVNVGAYSTGDLGGWFGIIFGAIGGWCLGAHLARIAKRHGQPQRPESRGTA